MKLSVLTSIASVALVSAQCPDYADYSTTKHTPYSSGAYQLSSMRPAQSCRTAVSPQVDTYIANMQSTISDPDLYRLFQNSFPNTLDTAVKWSGYAANNSQEELTFLITGDINAMWLRDSANQMQSYVSFLTNSTSTNSTNIIAKLYRGVINLQSRYVQTSPFCNSFQAPAESGVAPSTNGAASDDTVNPPYDATKVFECKYELDSLAAFLEISHNYYYATSDLAFFGKFQWISAAQTVLNTAKSMMAPTYADNGAVNTSPYTFTRSTTSGTETLNNGGKGNPVAPGTGLVRSAFRPSDDDTIYQLFIPANMMFSRYLGSTAAIAAALGQASLAQEMKDLSNTIAAGIQKWGIVNDPVHGQVYAYEVDGFGGRNLMDDANIPSLLASPVFGYTSVDSKLYDATRRMILSVDNPYFMRGPVINAVGGPHNGPGYAWPMASIARILTSSNDTEIYTTLKEIVSSTAGLGLIHESIWSFDQTKWTRQWFSWANGLFGQMILDLAQRKPEILKMSYQP